MALVVAIIGGTRVTADVPCHFKDIDDAYDRLIPIGSELADDTLQQRGSEVVRAVGGMSITIRFVPGDTSAGREARVVLSDIDAGGVADIWLPAEASIYTQLRELRRKNPEVCDELHVQSIAVTHSTVRSKVVTDLLRRLRKLRVPAVQDESMYVDTDRIELRIDAPMNRSVFVLYDGGANRRHPLVVWARDVLAKTAFADRK